MLMLRNATLMKHKPLHLNKSTLTKNKLFLFTTSFTMTQNYHYTSSSINSRQYNRKILACLAPHQKF